MNDKNSYLIISPCRNEAQHMRQTLDSVVKQTVLPSLWVIVDDGSTDQTPCILKEYADKHEFIKVVSKENRGHRSVGPGVIDAFYAGYDTVDLNQFDFLCKLDLDLDLPEKYFETLLKRMQENPRIGTCSGKAYYLDKNGNLTSEKCGDENAVGASKFYRKECFLQIGGFIRQVMWDGIDGHRCRMLGWIACSWDDDDLRFIHLRPMGSSQKGIITGRMRHGYGQYFMGTGPVYMTASALYRMTRSPLIIGGLAMWWGYTKSVLAGEERLEDPAFRAFIRRYQWSCLLRGKKKTTASYHQQGASIWDPTCPEVTQATINQ
ncbi:glycosyltransferase [Desulfogranum mediterraneum]|uniref:glycosyltransferase n=1 Tax=Desulfogranum mediterraneum TaxID=160661 RepID=UPI0004210935|nr:glycosyltransferase family A protein [Desulfogranum mediterraneum]